MTGISVDFGLEVRAGMDKLAGRMDGLSKSIETLRAREPFFTKVVASATSPSSGAFALDLGTPNPGFWWQVRRIVIGGDNWGSTVAGTAELVVTAGGSSLIAPATARTIPDTIDEYATLPVARFYSSKQIVVKETEHLMLLFVSPTGSTLYSANAGIEVFRTIAAPESFTA